MSAADEAYRAAEVAIAEAKRTGTERLWFDGHPVRALDRLPRSVAALESLRDLNLIDTQVSDLSPLAGLTGLRTLSLANTQVRDMRPLRGLHKLADDPEHGGLNFKGIPATSDPRIAKIAVIHDGKERAAALIALDAGWEPPGALVPVPLEPDPLLRAVPIDGKLEIAADPPTD